MTKSIGATKQFPPVVNIANYIGKNVFKITGDPNIEFGFGISDVRDFNNDGFSDFLIYGFSINNVTSSSYLVFGNNRHQNIDLSALNSSEGIYFESNTPSLPIKVQGLDRLDNDNFSDLAFTQFCYPGVRMNITCDPKEKGNMYVYYGTDKQVNNKIIFGDFSELGGFFAEGTNIGDMLGATISEVNADNASNLSSILVSNPNFINSDTNFGSAYLIRGTPERLSGKLSLDSLNGYNGTRLLDNHSNLAKPHFGISVKGIGDFNGDGYNDFVVMEADDWGRLYLVYGQAKYPSNYDMSTLDGSNGFIIYGFKQLLNGDVSAIGIGDINGDGLSDLAFASYNHSVEDDSNYYLDEYNCNIIFGTKEQVSNGLDISSLNGINGFVYSSFNYYEQSLPTYSLAMIDVNHDGFDDIIIGAAADNHGDGALRILLGKDGPFKVRYDVSDLDGIQGFSITSEPSKSAFGLAISSLTDFDGNGISELVVSAPIANNSSEAYILYDFNF